MNYTVRRHARTVFVLNSAGEVGKDTLCFLTAERYKTALSQL